MNPEITVNDQGQKKATRLTAQDVAALMSRSLQDAIERKTTLRAARMTAQIAASLAKVIEVADLEERVVEIERRLDERDKDKKKY